MNLLRRLLPGIALVIGTFLLSVGLQALAAWSAPSGSPPASNAYAPLNTGPTAQTKSGGLNVTGSVGIGTTVPTAPLHIYGVSGTDIYGTFGPATAGGTDGLNIGYGGVSFGAGQSFINAHAATAANARLKLLTNGTVQMTIDNSGNVGIGTASPGQKLDVQGGYIRSGTGFCIGASCITAWPAAGGSGTVTSVATNNGLTGGTFTTSGTLGLNLTGISTCTNATTNKIYWNGSYLACGTDQTGGAGGLTGSGSTNYISKWTGATSLGNSLIYDNGTNVGIGTGAPGYKLDVQGGDIRTSGKIGAGGFSPNSGYPSGWGGGLHVGDIYAEWTIGAGQGGALNAYINQQGNGYFAGNVKIGALSIVPETIYSVLRRDAGYWWLALDSSNGNVNFANGNATINSGGYFYNNSTINTADVWLRNANGGAGKWASQTGGLGAWSGNLAVDTTYYAATDGFVTATIGYPTGNHNCRVSIETPVGIVRQWAAPNSDGVQISEMSPVRKGDSWKVNSNANGSCGNTFYIYWMPLGN